MEKLTTFSHAGKRAWRPRWLQMVPDDDLKIKRSLNWDHLRPIIFGRGFSKFQQQMCMYIYIYINIYYIYGSFWRDFPQQNSAWSLGWVNTISWPLEIPEIAIPRLLSGLPMIWPQGWCGTSQEETDWLVILSSWYPWLTKNVSTSKPYHKLLARLLNKNRSPKLVEEVMRFTYLTTVSGWITPDFLSYLSSMVNEVVVIWRCLDIQNLRASPRGEKIMMEWHSHNSHILVVVSAYVLTMVLMFFFFLTKAIQSKERGYLDVRGS